jgi:iron complex outermembrane recepter protein
VKNTVSNDQIRRSVRAICLGGVSISLGAISAPSLAQTAPTANAPASDELAEITVTGIRASLQKSLEIKQNSVGVVDAISAEDIGQFPDSNLANAIMRIPGVSVSRGIASMGGLPSTTGDATQITVRGFGPSFNETLYDGRQASNSTGTGGGFDFSAVGADFVDEVDIQKTPDASLSSGAIGATINIKYPKPFDYPGFKLASSVSGTYSPDEGKYTPNGGLLVSDTFADNTFGVLADFAYSDHKVRENHVNIQGWTGFLAAPSQLAGAAPGASTTGSLPSWEIQDYGVYQEHTEDERVDGRLVMQWRPMDALLVTVNDDYSRHLIKQDQAGYSVWFNSGGITDAVRSGDGTLTSYVQNNTPTDFQGQINGSVVRNNEFGANIAWDVTDHFKAVLDADSANSRLNPSGQLSSIDSDVGYGPSVPGNTLNGGNVGIAGIATGSLPYPTSIGPGGNAALFINNGIIGSHVLPISQPNNDDTINQFKIDGQWSGDHIKADFGFQYIDDTQNLKEFDDFQNNDWQAFAGYGPASGNLGTHGVALPQSFFTNSFTTGSNFVPGFNNNGKLPAAIIVYNPYTVLNYLQGLGNPQVMNVPGYNVGCCATYAGAYTPALSVGSVQRVEEKVLAPFISISEDQQIAGMTLKEKFGARYEETTVYTAGLGQEPTSLTVQASDHTAFQVAYGPTSAVQSAATYRYLLPNLDLNLGVTDAFKVRFDASRTLTRPPLSDINPVTTVTQGQRTNSLSASGGNPNLLPFLSDNLDLGAEWYYSRNSYVSVDLFDKEVTNFIVAGTTQQTINGVIDPTKGVPAEFSVSASVNGPSAEVRGVELGLQHVFWDTGFGVTANATFVSTNKPYNPNDLTTSFAVTGIGNSANFIAFYEKYGFHSRVAVNWRAEYLDHFGQTQNIGIYGAEPVFVNANTQVDLSASYDITKNFDVYFEGLNLNDSTFSTHGRFPEQVLDVIAFGPRYTVGVHFRL